MKTPPCPLGPKHAWSWVKNVTHTTANARSVHMSLKGRYRCACGATKFGQPNHDGPDLRGLVGGTTFVQGTTLETKS